MRAEVCPGVGEAFAARSAGAEPERPGRRRRATRPVAELRLRDRGAPDSAAALARRSASGARLGRRAAPPPAARSGRERASAGHAGVAETANRLSRGTLEGDVREQRPAPEGQRLPA